MSSLFLQARGRISQVWCWFWSGGGTGRDGGRTDDRLGLKAANRAVAELKPDDDDDDAGWLTNAN